MLFLTAEVFGDERARLIDGNFKKVRVALAGFDRRREARHLAGADGARRTDDQMRDVATRRGRGRLQACEIGKRSCGEHPQHLGLERTVTAGLHREVGKVDRLHG
jgi:hypothetical protein